MQTASVIHARIGFAGGATSPRLASSEGLRIEVASPGDAHSDPGLLKCQASDVRKRRERRVCDEGVRSECWAVECARRGGDVAELGGEVGEPEPSTVFARASEFAASSSERSASPELRPVEVRTARQPVRGPCAVRPPTAAVVVPTLRSPRPEQPRRSPVVVWAPKSPWPPAFTKPSGREVDIPTATRIGNTCAAQAGFETPTRPSEGDSEKRRLGFGLTPVRQMPTLLANLHASGSPACLSKPEGQK
eukprot:CAMPEP_0203942566 /NCGR_PEP_ID=MMETSP0359-20131031/78721_1 /ASSEMBLY_ACC=CAM_ASM_000338 /TAXON_ID=268821 /ORGANISM="Scrippsiella Hangoei, Strain SHTV-5" /LENGTH=247 /DNA_ID=CAMNT_0050873293 /DNA_START=42 /DNA_END=785 /DNA_ORIENTATION=+